jgi:hypothetical protein
MQARKAAMALMGIVTAAGTERTGMVMVAVAMAEDFIGTVAAARVTAVVEGTAAAM